MKLTYLELFLDFLEIQEITEILEILEIRAQICLNVSRMMQGVIGATPPGGFGGAEAPPRCRPPSFLVVKKKVKLRQKVASIWLKIAMRVAYG